MDTNSRDIYNVTRLNREVRAVLEGSFPAIWVEGEISNLARPASGHWYFSLKDQSSQVRCAMFKNRNRNLKFSPENGMQVIARANVGLYEGRGEFQLIIETLEPAGAGALQKAFEELKQKLHKEGIFEEKHKQALPTFPGTIGVITSPSGAAIQDILNVLKRRYVKGNIIIYPVPVQGEGSSQIIADALKIANERKECDVLILARGGGSLEDLWSFNEENVARAIFGSSIPVISGVGHEIDFTIADFVADQRAPTPSAAAELVSPDLTEIQERLTNLQHKLQLQTNYRLQQYKQNLIQLEKRIPHPARQLQNISQRLDDMSLRLQQSTKTLFAVKHSQLLKLSGQINTHNPLQRLKLYRDKSCYLTEQLHSGMSHYLTRTKEKLHHLGHGLHTVSPLATLDRGYAIVTEGETNKIIHSANTLKQGQTVKTRFSKGQIYSSVEKIIEND